MRGVRGVPRIDEDTVLPFRQYYNHMFESDAITERRMVKMQGVMKSTTAKVQFGMLDYQLMRSVKFGNVCVDCMHTLDSSTLYACMGWGFQLCC